MIRASTILLILSAIVYLLMMSLIVLIDDFFLRMYGQMAAGSLYVFSSAIALVGRYNGLDEVASEHVRRDREEKRSLAQLKKRREEEEQKKK